MKTHRAGKQKEKMTLTLIQGLSQVHGEIKPRKKCAPAERLLRANGKGDAVYPAVPQTQGGSPDARPFNVVSIRGEK